MDSLFNDPICPRCNEPRPRRYFRTMYGKPMKHCKLCRVRAKLKELGLEEQKILADIASRQDFHRAMRERDLAITGDRP